ncbi:MAG: M56 family metallopeptidase [Flavobacteriaceae bacterium]|nr:M56 family metallopeptidase [Flavobacteriaceae bacterium]
MIDYIIQVLLFQVVFLAIYDFTLKKESFFQWNRVYLIFTSLFAYIIPVLKFKKAEEIVPQGYVEMLPEIILSPSTYVEKQLNESAFLFEGLYLIFFIGIVLSTALFIYKIKQLFILIYQNRREVNPNYNLILLDEKHTAFSFFNYIFIGKTIQKKEKIITHELVHVRQKHSIDLLVFEIQKIVFWFNPFSYLFQHRISEVHEFIADSKSVSKEDKSTYFQGLLAEIFQVEKFAFINSFNKQSFIKKRIIMLNKKNSKETLKFKYLLLIPILMGMMIYTSCKTYSEKIIDEPNVINKKASKSDAVPFAIVNQVPVFSGCEGTNVEKKRCFIENIQKHVGENYNTSISKNLELGKREKKIYVQFVIDKTGNIVNIRSRAAHKNLEVEAIRVIESLPQMKPGEHNGKKVGVKYTLPITLNID